MKLWFTTVLQKSDSIKNKSFKIMSKRKTYLRKMNFIIIIKLQKFRLYIDEEFNIYCITICKKTQV